MRYDNVIVGGGLAGGMAAQEFREQVGAGSVLIIAREAHLPYHRPPLTKGLWHGKEESSIWRGTEELGVELALGRRIVSLDLDQRRATDDRGDEYGYERLLLATGGRPRRQPLAGHRRGGRRSSRAASGRHGSALMGGDCRRPRARRRPSVLRRRLFAARQRLLSAVGRLPGLDEDPCAEPRRGDFGVTKIDPVTESVEGYSPDEMMAVAAARTLNDGQV